MSLYLTTLPSDYINMHIPSKFKETNLDTLYQLITDYPLATLITSDAGQLDACHTPFHLNKSDSGEVVLQSHIAKANDLWQTASNGQDVLLVFNGPNSYISPNFYPSKKETGKVVPTWNYSVVHVKGQISFKHEKKWLLQLLETLSDFHENKSQERPWSVSDAPQEFTDKLLDAVVGIEIKINDIVGNFKLSQNKSSEDYAGVTGGLDNSGNVLEALVAKQMKR